MYSQKEFTSVYKYGTVDDDVYRKTRRQCYHKK